MRAHLRNPGGSQPFCNHGITEWVGTLQSSQFQAPFNHWKLAGLLLWNSCKISSCVSEISSVLKPDVLLEGGLEFFLCCSCSSCDVHREVGDW